MKLLSILLTVKGHPAPGGFFGAYAPSYFLWCWFFAILGAYVMLNIEANSRNIDSTKTPKSFSYGVLLRDNWQRLLFNLVIMYLALRFSPEIMGRPLTEAGALIAGASLDAVVIFFKKLRGRKK